MSFPSHLQVRVGSSQGLPVRRTATPKGKKVPFISGGFRALGHLTALPDRAPAACPSAGGDQKDAAQGGCCGGSGGVGSTAVAAARSLYACKQTADLCLRNTS